ncbi:heavy-metal-associated domain-containing protein [Streptomyces sp. NPDC100445]|uniref:heavy-metal-associated domain-containing protein n=1 Tax=Streptomyces sp. NPDC100445 TaxID=3366102 RepID=UPI003805BF96
MSCCTPDGNCSSTNATVEVAEGTTTVYNVSGMTCAHCKATLTKEIGALDSVLLVDVDVDAGRVSVTTSGESDDVLLAKVVDEAGYELTGRAA